jgi:EutQ-like cupin domain
VIVVTGDDGSQRTFRAGDAFVSPAGFVGTWEIVEPARGRASELVCGLVKDRNPDVTPLFVQRGLVSGMQVKSGRKSFIASDSHCKNRSRLYRRCCSNSDKSARIRSAIRMLF